MRDEKIYALLDEKETSAFGVRIPKIMLDRISAAYKKVTGGAVRGNPKGPALAYFAARGLLDWEDEHREDSSQKKYSRRSSEG